MKAAIKTLLTGARCSSDTFRASHMTWKARRPEPYTIRVDSAQASPRTCCTRSRSASERGMGLPAWSNGRRDEAGTHSRILSAALQAGRSADGDRSWSLG